MEIRFEESTHTYWINGIQYPSVTQLFEKYHLKRAYYRPGYATLGRRAHQVLAEIDSAIKFGFEYPEEDISDDLKGFVCAWANAKEEKKILIDEIEVRCASEVYKFAGTVDRIGTINDKLSIIDIKTGSCDRNDPVQLCGYRMAAYEYWRSEHFVGADSLLVAQLANVYINKDGSFTVRIWDDKEVEEAIITWKAILRLEHWRK